MYDVLSFWWYIAGAGGASGTVDGDEVRISVRLGIGF